MVETIDRKTTQADGASSRRERQIAAKDIRALIPPLGLKEYWYPAVEARKVKNKPYGLKICGVDLVFFKGERGEVKCLWNVCPHRGGSLMHGDCHYPGTISCPYHGWTFDGDGNVLAVLPEGPDSQVPGKVRARAYPTVTLKGMVFVWMGDGDPVPPEEDIPPEFFDDRSTILYFTEMWPANWNVALENGSDAHVPYVHRDSWRNLLVPMSPFTGPYGGRNRIVNDKAVISGSYTGRVPSANAAAAQDRGRAATRSKRPWKRQFFPKLNGYWPRRTTRNWWNWVSLVGTLWDPPIVFKNDELPEEWRSGHHLPMMYRGNRGNCFYSRACVAVTENTSRQIYYKAVRPGNALGMAYERLHWILWGKRQQANFSHQDMKAIGPQVYDAQENLSATDTHQVLWRRLILRARGMEEYLRQLDETKAEEFNRERLREVGHEEDRIAADFG